MMAHDTHNDWLTPSGDPASHERAPDAAAESLARALRMSFRLLTVIMLVIVAAFMLTGVRSVEPGKAAVVYRFGRIVGTVESGLCFAWPFPIGKIEMVDTSQRSLQIDDFWMAERLEDIANKVPLSQRRTESDGLRPGWDGALLTGDGRLVHVRLTCNYSVTRNVADAGSSPAELYVLAVSDDLPDPVDPHRPRRDTASLVRSAVCRAAIRTGSSVTAEGTWGRQGEFGKDVAKLAQVGLDDLRTGIRIESVNITGITWPLRVLPDFEAATAAGQEARKTIAAAKADAEQILIRAAGTEYVGLVGQPHVDPHSMADSLIGRYVRAVDNGETEKARQLMADIGTYFVKEVKAGEVRPILDRAASGKQAMLDGLAGRLNRYQQLLPEFYRNPEIVMNRLWAETRDSLLGDAAIEKFYVSPGEGKVVIQLDRDPSTAKQVRRRLLKTADEDGE